MEEWKGIDKDNKRRGKWMEGGEREKLNRRK